MLHREAPRRSSSTPLPRARLRLLASALLSLVAGVLLAVLATPASAADGPVFTSSTAVQSSTTVSWAGTVPAGASVVCTVTAPDGSETSPACATADGFAVTVSGASDGSWTLLVTTTVVTPDGETTASDSRTTVVDTVAPDLVVTTPANPSAERTVTWTVTVSGGTATCTVTGPGLSTSGSCGPSFTTTLPASPGGEYLLRATAEDAAGNTRTVDADPYVLLVPPPSADVQAPASPSADPTVSWTFSTHGAAATCALTGPGTSVLVEGCTSPFARTLGTDGTYVLEVTLTGPGGSSTSSAAYVLDTTAPAQPTVTGPSGRTTATTLSWTFPDDEDGECVLRRSGTVVDTALCRGSYTATGLSDGTYTLDVVLVDAAGNRSLVGTSDPVAVDTTAPDQPQVLSGPSGLTNGGSSRSFTWNVTTLTDPDRTECRLLGGGGSGAWEVCPGSYTVATTGLPDGDYVFEVRSIDDLGNSSASTVVLLTLDATAPVLRSVTAPPSPSRTAVVVVEWDGDADGRPTCTAALGDTVVWTVVDCAPSWTVDLSGQPDGTWTFTVVLVDAAGNASAELSALYALDRQPPGPVTFTSQPAPTAQRTPSWSFVAVDAVRYTCRLVGPDGAELLVTRCDTGTFTTTLSGPDGAYRLEVTADDGLGNVTAAASSTHVLDTAAPAAPTLSAPPGPSTSRSWPVSWTGEAGAGSRCTLLHEGVVVDGPVSCTSTTTVSLEGRPDGRWTLRVELVDAAGNVSGPAEAHYVLDTTAPPVPTFTTEPGTSSDRRPTWQFASDGAADTRLFCRLVGPTRTYLDGLCTSPLTQNLDGQPDGAYELTVWAVDALGNTSASARSTYLLDTQPPQAPTVLSAPAPSSTRDPVWQLQGPSDAVLVCRLVGPTGTVHWDGVCTATFAPGPVTGPDGTYALTVWSRDAAGNLSTTTATSSWLLDTVRPAAPVFTRAPATGSDRAPWWTFTAEAGAVLTCTLRDGAGTVLDVADCSTGRYDAALAGSDGPYVLSVVAADVAGNASDPATATYVLDTASPAAPVLRAVPGPLRTPSWAVEWDGEAGARATCVLRREGVVVETDGDCPRSRTWTLAGQDGTWTVTVVLTDAAGNTGPSSSASVVLDTTPPEAPVVVRAPATAPDRFPTWDVTYEPDAVLVCRLTGPDGVVRLSGDCSSPVRADLTGAPDGRYDLVLAVRDAAGNLSPETTSAYVLDTTAPLPPRFLTVPPATGSVRTVTWTFISDDAERLECLLVGPGGPVGDWAACLSGSFTAELPGADGPYSLHVRARDTAGNLSAETSSTYVLDTVAPPAVSVTAPRSPWNSRSPSWQLSGEAGARLECRVDGGAWSTCGSTFVLDLAGAADRAYLVEFRAVDAAGNAGPATGSTYVLDTQPPAAPAWTSVPPPSFDPRPTWTWSVPSDAVGSHCVLRAPDGSLLASVPCGTSYTAALDGLPDGTYVLEVLVTDLAGNASAAITAGFVRDTQAPAPPVLAAPPSPGNDRRPVWGISGEGAASCRLLSGTTALSDWTACGPTWSPDLTGLPDGTYTVEVRLTDVAGNVSGTTSSTYVLDTVPPPPPVVTSPPGSPSNAASATWTVAGTESGAVTSCRLVRGTTVVLDWAPCAAAATGSPFPVDLSGLPDGTYRLEARHTDAAGNTGATAGASFVRDTTPPAPVTVTPPVSPGSGRSPEWRFATEAGAVLSCRIGDVGEFGPCGPDGTLVVDLTSAPDGTVAVWVRATDLAGNTGEAVRTTYVLDTTRPDAPRLTAPSGPSSNTAPAWTWTGEAGAVGACELRRDGALVLTSSCLSPWSPSLVGDGTWVLTLRLVDAAGNRSLPVEASYVLDTAPPAAPVVAGPSSPNSSGTPVFTATAEPGAAIECRLLRESNGRLVELTSWGPCPSPYTPTLTTTGVHVLEVRARDAADNLSPVTRYVYDYDLAYPAGLTSVQVPTSPGSNPRPTWLFTAPAGTTVTCRTETSSGALLAEQPCSGSYTAVLPADGDYRVVITVVDGLGNVGSLTSVYRLDTTGPAAPRVSPVGLAGPSPLVDWSWTGDAEAVWECRLTRDGVEVHGWVRCASPTRADLSSTGEGAYRLQVRGRDALGNVGAEAVASYTYDRTPPVATNLTSLVGTAGPSRTVPWTFTVPADAVGARCSVVRDGQTVRQAVSCLGGSFTMDLAGQPEGRYDLVVELFDRAENRSVATAAYVLSSVLVRGPAPVPVPPRPPAEEEEEEPTVRPAPVLARPTLVVGDIAPPAVPLPRPPTTVDPFPSSTEDSTPAAEQPGEVVDEPTAQAPVLGLPDGPISGARAVEALKDVAGETIRRPQLPIALLLLVALFLAVQNRIDRRDPKLAMAEVEEEPLLDFRPYRGGPTTGGAPA